MENSSITIGLPATNAVSAARILSDWQQLQDQLRVAFRSSMSRFARSVERFQAAVSDATGSRATGVPSGGEVLTTLCACLAELVPLAREQINVNALLARTVEDQAEMIWRQAQVIDGLVDEQDVREGHMDAAQRLLERYLDRQRSGSVVSAGDCPAAPPAVVLPAADPPA